MGQDYLVGLAEKSRQGRDFIMEVWRRGLRVALKRQRSESDSQGLHGVIVQRQDFRTAF